MISGLVVGLALAGMVALVGCWFYGLCYLRVLWLFVTLCGSCCSCFLGLCASCGVGII